MVPEFPHQYYTNEKTIKKCSRFKVLYFGFGGSCFGFGVGGLQFCCL